MLAWPCQGMLLMRWRWGVSSQIWSRASLISWTVWGVIWWHWMDQNVLSQQCSVGFQLGELGGHVSSVNSFILLHNLTAWNHCQTRTRWKMLQVQYNILHGFSRPFHVCQMCSGWTGTHLWSTSDSQKRVFLVIENQMNQNPKRNLI